MTDARYAIYYAPAPDEPLWRFGSAVIGYDAATGRPAAPLVPANVPAPLWGELTAEPRRYGFHATIKAPFRLAAGQTEAALLSALAAFAKTVPAFAFDIEVRGLGGFVALVPVEAPPALAALERAAVVAFEPFRAPLTQEEMARRQKAGLTARQAALLAQYGYPYVHDEFRFHMTLTGRLPSQMRASTEAALAAAHRAAVGAAGIRLDGLCLFRQETGAAPFRIICRAKLG